MPSTNAASCADVNRIAPSVTGGHRNASCSKRFQNSTRPKPSQATIFIPSARLARNTKIVPENGFLPKRLAHPPLLAFPQEPRSCRRLHGPQRIPQPANVNAGFCPNHRPRDLDYDSSEPQAVPSSPIVVTGTNAGIASAEDPDGQPAPLCATRTDVVV
jgi:hypothetical protein